MDFEASNSSGWGTHRRPPPMGEDPRKVFKLKIPKIVFSCKKIYQVYFGNSKSTKWLAMAAALSLPLSLVPPNTTKNAREL